MARFKGSIVEDIDHLVLKGIWHRHGMIDPFLQYYHQGFILDYFGIRLKPAITDPYPATIASLQATRRTETGWVAHRRESVCSVNGRAMPAG
jgi:hypothetical protein